LVSNARLDSTAALRLAIFAIEGIIAFLATTSNGRGAKLDTWLGSPASSLAPAERHNLEEWVKTNLIQNGVVSEKHVNPGPHDMGLRLIVYQGLCAGS
jgi:hypothetical protein